MNARILKHLSFLILSSMVLSPAAVQALQEPHNRIFGSEKIPLPADEEAASSALPLSQSSSAARTQLAASGLRFSEGFDDITGLAGRGWVLANNSEPLGFTGWFQGEAGTFPAATGDAASYIAANYKNTNNTGTISSWLITPPMEFWNGDKVTFYTRTVAGSLRPDRLELRMSLNGSSSSVGSTATSVGDFTTLLLTVNDGLAVEGYPETWTQFSATLSGLAAPTTGRLGFRYFVTNGGPAGSNSDYIGIDDFGYFTYPDIQVSPGSITATLTGGSQSAQILTINNHGSAQLSYTVKTQAEPVFLAQPTGSTEQAWPSAGQAAPLLAGAFEGAIAGPAGPRAALSTRPVNLVLDDGTIEGNFGMAGGGQFLWMNRYTPEPRDYPFRLEEIRVLFGGSSVSTGELVDLYIYTDSDGDPSNGAVHAATYKNAAVQATDGTTWSVYEMAMPVRLEGPGDVLIAVVNRTAGVGPGNYPAMRDTTASQGRSWVGRYEGNPADPPVLPPPIFTVLDDTGLFSGNWMVRGYGTQGCQGAGVPWLEISQLSGDLPPYGSATLTLSINASGAAEGVHSGYICIGSNDPDSPLVEIPVQLEVIPASPVFLPMIIQ